MRALAPLQLLLLLLQREERTNARMLWLASLCLHARPPNRRGFPSHMAAPGARNSPSTITHA